MIKIEYKNLKIIFTDNRINLSYKHIPYETAKLNWERFKNNYLDKGVKLSYLTQIHSGIIRVADKEGWQGWGDGLITERKNLGLVIFLADCTPLAIFDSSGKVICNLHCGWRSVYHGIIQRAIDRIRSMGVERLLAVIGPSAKICCYEVKEDVVERFSEYPQAFKIINGKTFFSLNTVIREILTQYGVDILYESEVCTICCKNFFSYRRTKGKERQISLIYKS